MNKDKKVPSFWLDFNKNGIVVESDDKEYPIIAFYPTVIGRFCDDEIKEAESLISDLNAGRKNYRMLAKLIDKREIS